MKCSRSEQGILDDLGIPDNLLTNTHIPLVQFQNLGDSHDDRSQILITELVTFGLSHLAYQLVNLLSGEGRLTRVGPQLIGKPQDYLFLFILGTERMNSKMTLTLAVDAFTCTHLMRPVVADGALVQSFH